MKSHYKIHVLILLFLLFYSPCTVGQTFDSVEYYLKSAQKLRFKDLDSIKILALKVRDYGIRNHDPKGRMAFHSITGVLIEEQGKYDDALLHYDSAMNIAKSLNDSLQMARIHHHIGVAYKERSLYDLAFENLFMSLRIAEKYDEIYLIAISQMNISMVYMKMGKLDLAKNYAQLAYSLTKQKQELANIATGSLIELGNNHIMTGNLDSAIIVFEQANELLERANLGDGKSIVANNLGALYYYKNDFDRAISYFEITVDLARKSNDQKTIALGFMNLGDTYMAMKKHSQAETHLLKSLEILKPIRHLQFIRDNYDFLARLEQTRGNFQKALGYTTLMHSYKDTILNEATASRIAELQTQYETEKKDSEIKTLKAEAQIKELEIANTRIVVIAVIGVAILFIGLILYINRQRAIRFRDELQRDRFKVVIEAEEKERKRVSRELHDGLGQMLSTVRLFVSDFDDRKQNPKVDRSLHALDATIAEVRNISHNLMPLKLMELGLPAAVAEMAEKLTVSGQLQVNIENLDLLTFDESVSTGIYRTLQEIINNAIKYAKATSILISAVQVGNSISISVKDDGQGFNTEEIARSKGIGWSNIFSRMELIGGTVFVKSGKEGTTVQLLVPANILMQKAG